MSQLYQATNQFLLKIKPLWCHQEKPNRLLNLHKQSHNKSKGLSKTKLNLKINNQSNHQNNQIKIKIKENNRSNHLKDKKSKDNRRILPQMIQGQNQFRTHSLTDRPTTGIKIKSKNR
jgi:ABC-type molybdate transport system ATPase subunit